jgi:hypothetical protein
LEDVIQLTRQLPLEVHTVHQKLLGIEGENKEVKRRKQFATALNAIYRTSLGDKLTSSLQEKSEVTGIRVECDRNRDALELHIAAVAKRINWGDEGHSRMMEEEVRVRHTLMN